MKLSSFVTHGLLQVPLWVGGMNSWNFAEASEIFLPIEVLGSVETIESVEVELTSGASGAVWVWLKAHNLSYDGKGSVRLNGSDWVSLENGSDLLEIEEPGQSYGGIGGGFSTIRLRVSFPIDTFREGLNELSFQFARGDGVSSGYRILDLDITKGDGESVLRKGQKVYDDPNLWQAPLGEIVDIEAGRDLWSNADLTDAGGAPIMAKCSDCHAENGADLKYFNYSNKSIIERSVFHSLSRREGEQIASYIRTLDYYQPDRGRPWNPPYQPGRGIDSRPVTDWAAGAGLDAILESDEAMLPYLFGDGSRDDIDAATDIRSDLNLREMPVAVQFPDWRLWLPRIHPMDILGREFWENSGTNSGNQSFKGALEAYWELKDRFENEDLASSQDLIKEVERFSAQVMWWVGNANSGHPWTSMTANDGLTMERALANGYRAEEAKLEIARWHAVKLWELLHGFEAEDKAARIRSTAEKYQWPNNHLAVFQIAAHFIGDDRGTSAFIGEDLVVGTYFSSVWYQLQMTLNAGMRSGYDVAPVDWAYNFYHVNRLGRRSGVYEPLRLFQNLIKGYQQRDRDGEIAKEVWSMREVSPWRLFSDAEGDESTHEILDTYRPGLRNRVTASMLEQFLRRSAEYEDSDWPRTNERTLSAQNWFKLEDESYAPVAEPDAVTFNHLFSVNGASDAIEADAMYRLAPRLHELGVSFDLVDDLARWSARFWPLGDWMQFVKDTDEDGMLDDWELANFGDLSHDGKGDFDGDGWDDSQEFRRMSDPTDGKLIPVLEVIDGDRVRMVYRENSGGNNLSLEASTNLEDWDGELEWDSEESVYEEGRMEAVFRSRIPGDRVFYRVRE